MQERRTTCQPKFDPSLTEPQPTCEIDCDTTTAMPFLSKQHCSKWMSTPATYTRSTTSIALIKLLLVNHSRSHHFINHAVVDQVQLQTCHSFCVHQVVTPLSHQLLHSLGQLSFFDCCKTSQFLHLCDFPFPRRWRAEPGWWVPAQDSTIEPLCFFSIFSPPLIALFVDQVTTPLAGPVHAININLMLDTCAVKVEPIPAPFTLNHLARPFSIFVLALSANAVLGWQFLYDWLWVEQSNTFQLRNCVLNFFQRLKPQDLVGLWHWPCLHSL